MQPGRSHIAARAPPARGGRGEREEARFSCDFFGDARAPPTLRGSICSRAVGRGNERCIPWSENSLYDLSARLRARPLNSDASSGGRAAAAAPACRLGKRLLVLGSSGRRARCGSHRVDQHRPRLQQQRVRRQQLGQAVVEPHADGVVRGLATQRGPCARIVGTSRRGDPHQQLACSPDVNRRHDGTHRQTAALTYRAPGTAGNIHTVAWTDRRAQRRRACPPPRRQSSACRTSTREAAPSCASATASRRTRPNWRWCETQTTAPVKRVERGEQRLDALEVRPVIVRPSFEEDEKRPAGPLSPSSTRRRRSRPLRRQDRSGETLAEADGAGEDGAHATSEDMDPFASSGSRPSRTERSCCRDARAACRGGCRCMHATRR